MDKSERNPKGAGRKPLAEEKGRTALQINKSLIKKVKYICLMDNLTQTDAINQSIELFVSDWEEKNGKIVLK